MPVYRLDTSALIMPAVTNSRKTSFFRLEAQLRKPVDRVRLQAAIDRLAPRYAHLFVSLKNTWNTWVLVTLPKPPVVELDGPFPCQGSNVRVPGTPLVRFRIQGACLAVEVSHIVADGVGARELLKAVLAAYLTESRPSAGKPPPEEFEDSFFRHNRPGSPWPKRPTLAWTVPGHHLPVGHYRTTRLELSFQAVKARARARELTVTEYLATMHLQTLLTLFVEQENAHGLQMPRRINLMIPIDLRKTFASVTHRNFIGMAVISAEPADGLLSLGDLAHQVRAALREQKQPSETLKQISRNASAAKNPLVRLLPRWIKSPLLRLLFSFFGEALVTSHLSNLGGFDLAAGTEAEVEAITFLPGGSERPGIAVGVVCLGDKLRLGFGSLLEADSFERIFCSLLIAEHLLPTRVDAASFSVHSQHL